ncbi:uncharacterized protein [Rutidosis leptorrhynchoides]|uniref:uncharacterized protein n=1 Tax=Rutidosis leptorrhynchoides TaxID=125765 RepID=UPI003A99418D
MEADVVGEVWRRRSPEIGDGLLAALMGDTEASAVTLITKLDFGDPLYLHPSDTSTTPLISLKLKGTENYKIWSRSVLLALETKNKVGFIDGTCIKNTTDEVLSKQWDRCNSVVLSWLLGSIADELYSGLIFSKNASTVWTELKETYDKVDGSVIFNVHHKINSLKQNGSSLSEYYHSLNALWKQYDTLVVIPTCNCATATHIVDHNKTFKLMQLLMGLDD